jgi:DNA-binding GntR family transcriptional regulator
MDLQSNAVSHKQLHHIVTERLRMAILNGQFKPGEWLRQQRIAKEFGVSQMPVREALRKLAAEGVVEHVPYRGARVVEFSPQDITDLYAHRSYLESRAARMAAESISSVELNELRDLQAQLRQDSQRHSPGVYRRLNHRFHQVIYSACRRDYLVRALDQVWSAFPTLMLSNLAQTEEQALAERDAKDLQEHEAILIALENGDGDRAAELMERHIKAACQELVSVLESEQ